MYEVGRQWFLFEKISYFTGNPEWISIRASFSNFEALKV